MTYPHLTTSPVSEAALRAELKRTFGYDDFKAGQLRVIRQTMAGGHSVFLAPTGNGKSLCYQLPALMRPGLTLVVSPLIALMKDQVDGLKLNGIEAEYLNSQLSWEERQLVQSNVRSGKTKLLYVSPERLISSDNLRAALPSLNINLVAIDEAHCISEWGHDFREDYRQLGQLRATLPNVPFMALTATATDRTLRDIVGQLKLHGTDVETVRVSLNRPNLRYEIRRKPRRSDALDELAGQINALAGHSCVVYCATRDETESVAEYLCERGINADYYHAGLEHQRSEKQTQFMEGGTQVMVATVAFGMGIDKEDIRLVAHWDMPKSIEAYYQETGRAGRDGIQAKCLLFYSPQIANTHLFFARQHSDSAIGEHAVNNIYKMRDLCETESTCRRRILLLHFDEVADAECGSCDNCTDERRKVDVTTLARAIVDTISSTNGFYGAKHIISIIRGSATRKVNEAGHDRLPTFGVARGNSDANLADTIQHLIDADILERTAGQFQSLKVTENGKVTVQSGEAITVRVKVPPKPRRERAASNAPTVFNSLPARYDTRLLADLKALRTKVANEIGKPAFVVFHDSTLIEMARLAPSSLSEMSRVKGVGASKLEAYGERFLTVINRRR